MGLWAIGAYIDRDFTFFFEDIITLSITCYHYPSSIIMEGLNATRT